MSNVLKDRWTVSGNEITWTVTEKSEHIDNMEMAGRRVAVVVYYGTNADGTLYFKKNLYYPMLRMIPNGTGDSLGHPYEGEEHLKFKIDGRDITEYPVNFKINGMIVICSEDEAHRLQITRFLLPTVKEKAFVEHIVIKNISDAELNIDPIFYENTVYERGNKGVYVLEATTHGKDVVTLAPGEHTTYDTVYTARRIIEERPRISGVAELVRRRDYADDLFSGSLVLETTDPILSCEFNFSKLRITESIFDTLGGPMHCPGGQRYYAAVWANDQAEYASPYFGFAGNEYAHSACVNLMDLYRPFMHPNLHHIPASIVAEGTDIWEAWGDEGDAAQYIYGMTRYLLQRGDLDLAREYFDTIDWCVRYELDKETEDHLIAADSDELENRLPAGDANLLNTSLVYGGLMCGAYMARELGYADKEQEYLAFAERLHSGIENSLGAEIHGYHTYRYFKGYDELRSYTASPLTVGIFDRKEDTVNALVKHLWTEDGFLSAESDKMFWDRSTLYVMRGIFRGGLDEVGYEYLMKYSRRRLLGEHVPYPIEAWPEGAQRHLSGESGLYARTIIEGMFGINPMGFSSFTVAPAIPESLGPVALRKIKAFGGCFDVEVSRSGDMYSVRVTNIDGASQSFEIKAGDSVVVKL